MFSGNDPTGGAGIQADIETLASMACHAAPVITSITIQDTENVKSFFPLEGATVREQARVILEDMPVAAIKIGLLGGLEVIDAIHSILLDYPDIPVVLDPILVAGGGSQLSDDEIVASIKHKLLPLVTLATPNSNEARVLAKEADNLEACAHEIMDGGCEYVLITGAHEVSDKVENLFFGNNRLIEKFEWQRLPNVYHGSGCTLAAGIAGLLAQGVDPLSAVHEAQEFTWKSLQNGVRMGMGQLMPNRFFWATLHEED